LLCSKSIIRPFQKIYRSIVNHVNLPVNRLKRLRVKALRAGEKS
jgi:hypothetical protein